MHEHRHERRVRVITDEEKYRRHQRKKLLRKAAQWIGVAVVLVGTALLLWLMLDRLMQPPPQE